MSDRIFKGTSAYTRIAAETCPRLAELGHVIGHIPTGRTNRMGNFPLGDVSILTSGLDPFGEDIAPVHYADFPADLLITNVEPWVYKSLYNFGIHWAPMVPLDHSPASVQIIGKINTAFRPIAISKFGQQELAKKNIESYLIPNGVNTEVFKPMNKVECKKAFYLDPDDFTVGIVAMNRSRKMISRMLRGYKRFLELNNDIKKSHLVLWTNVLPTSMSLDDDSRVSDVGEYLLPEIFDLGLEHNVTWPNWADIIRIGGLPDCDPSSGQDLVRLYNSFDANFLCSGGEGAGLTILESAAVGVSSVVTNYAAGPEYAGFSGFLVQANDYVLMNSPGVRRYLPNIDGMAEALTKIYNSDREKLARIAMRHAKQYDWNAIMENYWKPFLEECELELKPKITKGGIKTWA